MNYAQNGYNSAFSHIYVEERILSHPRTQKILAHFPNAQVISIGHYKDVFCRRGQQYCGANGDADVVGLPGIHIECKRVERLNLYDAVDQAKHDAKPDELPAVFHRKNHCEWLVTMPIDLWMEIYKEWEAGR